MNFSIESVQQYQISSEDYNKVNLSDHVGQNQFEHWIFVSTNFDISSIELKTDPSQTNFIIIENLVDEIFQEDIFGFWFMENEVLRSVLIFHPLKILGDCCFSNYFSLQSIFLPNTLISLGNKCFYNCSSIQSISLPNNLISLENDCFYNCSSLQSISLPNSITSLGNYCFSSCSSLQSISLPNSITSLGISCFSSCSSLQQIILPSSLKELSYNCFKNCSNLSFVYFPKSVKTLVQNPFENCDKLFEVISNEKPRIEIEEKSNFRIEIVEENGNKQYAIKGGYICLNSYFIPSQGSNKVDLFSHLHQFIQYEHWIFVSHGFDVSSFEIQTHPNKTIFIILENSVNEIYIDYSVISWEVQENKVLKSVLIMHPLRVLGDYCFYRCSSLQSISLPNFITSLGYCCFSHCSSLQSISLPNSLTSLESACFCGCSSLQSIKLPSSLTSIPQWCFGLCKSLHHIFIPKSVAFICKTSFGGCDKNVPCGSRFGENDPNFEFEEGSKFSEAMLDFNCDFGCFVRKFH